MASTGIKDDNIVLFTGGSDNPYNFIGIGYDGNPSKPSNQLFAYDLKNKEWKIFQDKLIASMDHRDLIEHQGSAYILCGIGKKSTC
jgi:hypothetical protein